MREGAGGSSTHEGLAEAAGGVQVSSGALQQDLCDLKSLPLFRPQFPHPCEEGPGRNDGLVSNKETS